MSGFSLGESVNSAADWVSGVPIIQTVVNNPICTALLFTALGAIVALALYGDAIRKGGMKLALRAALYFFLLATVVMFVHHHAVTKSVCESAHQKGVRDVFAGIQYSRESAAVGGAKIDSEAPLDGPRPSKNPVLDAGRRDNVAWDDLGIEDVVFTSPVHSSA